MRPRLSESPCGCTAGFESVVGFGEVSVVTGADERKKGLSLLLRQYGYTGAAELDARSLERTAVFKLTAAGFSAKRHD